MADSAVNSILVNGRQQPWHSGLTVAELLLALGMPGSGVAVEQNGRVVRRAEQGQVRLEPGDRIEIVRLVGGG